MTYDLSMVLWPMVYGLWPMVYGLCMVQVCGHIIIASEKTILKIHFFLNTMREVYISNGLSDSFDL
jgi:hypothetical protein